jgi:hypothetical protein
VHLVKALILASRYLRFDHRPPGSSVNDFGVWESDARTCQVRASSTNDPALWTTAREESVGWSIIVCNLFIFKLNKVCFRSEYARIVFCFTDYLLNNDKSCQTVELSTWVGICSCPSWLVPFYVRQTFFVLFEAHFRRLMSVLMQFTSLFVVASSTLSYCFNKCIILEYSSEEQDSKVSSCAQDRANYMCRERWSFMKEAGHELVISWRAFNWICGRE